MWRFWAVRSQGSVALEMGTVSAVPRVDVAEISTANGKSNGTNDRSSGESSHDTGNGSGDGNGNGNGKVVMVAPAAAPVGGNGKAVGGGVGSGSFFAAKGSANGGPPGMVISPSMAALQVGYRYKERGAGLVTRVECWCISPSMVGTPGGLPVYAACCRIVTRVVLAGFAGRGHGDVGVGGGVEPPWWTVLQVR